jgi:hypothetical protein
MKTSLYQTENIMINPITPSPELVQQWWEEVYQHKDNTTTFIDYVATEAARWGADQELEECCKLAPDIANYFRERRRPKPPSLKEQALSDLKNAYNADMIDDTTFENIRRALTQLPDN